MAQELPYRTVAYQRLVWCYRFAKDAVSDGWVLSPEGFAGRMVTKEGMTWRTILLTRGAYKMHCHIHDPGCAPHVAVWGPGASPESTEILVFFQDTFWSDRHLGQGYSWERLYRLLEEKRLRSLAHTVWCWAQSAKTPPWVSAVDLARVRGDNTLLPYNKSW